MSERIADELIGHSINIQRLDANMRKQTISVLNALQKELANELNKIDPTRVERQAYRKRRAEEFLARAQVLLTRAYAKMESDLAKELSDMVEVEGAFTAKVINDNVQVKLVSGVIAPEVVASIVTGTALFKGENLHQWFLAEKNTIKRALEGVINEGILLGASVDQMVRQIIGTKSAKYRDGIMRIARNRAETIVRTTANAISNTAKEAVYDKNSDLVKGKQWLSTLDTRTSDICIALDGVTWDLDNRPIGGHSTQWRGAPPAHPNCRSVIIPILKSWEELNNNPSIRQRIKRYEQRVKPSTRAAMDGKSVPETFTYENWLKKQSKQNQHQSCTAD